MSRTSLFAIVLVVIVATAFMGGARSEDAKSPNWSMKASIIEACSCPMFCQCYFNTEPATHGGGHAAHEGHGGGDHFCRFNNAFQVDKGRYGQTKLDGAKFWVAGDLGGDFSQGKMDWAVLHFDPAVTEAQRTAITTILGHLYPVEWDSFEVGKDAAIQWQRSKARAEARLDDGKLAEVVLHKADGMTDDAVVIHNLRYWGAPRNDGFVLMPNEVEAYRTGSRPFEFKGTNGFTITVDLSSADVAKAGS